MPEQVPIGRPSHDARYGRLALGVRIRPLGTGHWALGILFWAVIILAIVALIKYVVRK